MPKEIKFPKAGAKPGSPKSSYTLKRDLDIGFSFLWPVMGVGEDWHAGNIFRNKGGDTKGNLTHIHGALDIMGREGFDIIRASERGNVVERRDNTDNYGNFLKIEHYARDKEGNVKKNKDGKSVYQAYTAYGHLFKPTSLSKNSTVDRGQPIGLIGNTGNSSGAHLHFELFIGSNNQGGGFNPGSRVSPFEYMTYNILTDFLKSKNQIAWKIEKENNKYTASFPFQSQLNDIKKEIKTDNEIIKPVDLIYFGIMPEYRLTEKGDIDSYLEDFNKGGLGLDDIKNKYGFFRKQLSGIDYLINVSNISLDTDGNNYIFSYTPGPNPAFAKKIKLSYNPIFQNGNSQDIFIKKGGISEGEDQLNFPRCFRNIIDFKEWNNYKDSNGNNLDFSIWIPLSFISENVGLPRLSHRITGNSSGGKIPIHNTFSASKKPFEIRIFNDGHANILYTENLDVFTSTLDVYFEELLTSTRADGHTGGIIRFAPDTSLDPLGEKQEVANFLLNQFLSQGDQDILKGKKINQGISPSEYHKIMSSIIKNFKINVISKDGANWLTIDDLISLGIPKQDLFSLQERFSSNVNYQKGYVKISDLISIGYSYSFNKQKGIHILKFDQKNVSTKRLASMNEPIIPPKLIGPPLPPNFKPEFKLPNINPPVKSDTASAAKTISSAIMGLFGMAKLGLDTGGDKVGGAAGTQQKSGSAATAKTAGKSKGITPLGKDKYNKMPEPAKPKTANTNPAPKTNNLLGGKNKPGANSWQDIVKGTFGSLAAGAGKGSVSGAKGATPQQGAGALAKANSASQPYPALPGMKNAGMPPNPSAGFQAPTVSNSAISAQKSGGFMGPAAPTSIPSFASASYKPQLPKTNYIPESTPKGNTAKDKRKPDSQPGKPKVTEITIKGENADRYELMARELPSMWERYEKESAQRLI